MGKNKKHDRVPNLNVQERESTKTARLFEKSPGFVIQIIIYNLRLEF